MHLAVGSFGKALALNRAELDFVHAVVVDVDGRDGIASQCAFTQGAVGTSVAGIALALNGLGLVPCPVLRVADHHVNALAVAAARVGAGDATAALALESGETRALAGRPVAYALVGALLVEVTLVPLFRVIRASQTVRVRVLLAHQTVGELVLDLLVSVDHAVGVDVSVGGVDKRLAKEAQAVATVIPEEVELALAHTARVADAVPIAVVVAPAVGHAHKRRHRCRTHTQES